MKTICENILTRFDIDIDELMTGFLSPGLNPMSRLTIRALTDIGYLVDPNKADSYTFPKRRLRETPESSGKIPYGNDIMDHPRVQMKTRRKGHSEEFSLKPLNSIKRHDLVEEGR